MEQNESLYSIYSRFTDIVNTFGGLGKMFSNSKKVKKIIRSLPMEWRPKRIVIEEAKDLNTLPIDDLIVSLISYEEDLIAENDNKEKKKALYLKHQSMRVMRNVSLMMKIWLYCPRGLKILQESR